MSCLWTLIISRFELGNCCSYRRPLVLLSRLEGAAATVPPVRVVSFATTLRAGGVEIEKADDGETDGDDDDDDDDDSEEESEDEDEEKSLLSENGDVGSSASTDIRPYDKMLVASPSMQMYSVIGVMLLSRKLDMFNPTVVRIGR
jgi:hypothetical protein